MPYPGSKAPKPSPPKGTRKLSNGSGTSSRGVAPDGRAQRPPAPPGASCPPQEEVFLTAVSPAGPLQPTTGWRLSTLPGWGGGLKTQRRPALTGLSAK